MTDGTSGRLLGVDVGERRIGVAVSDGRIAVPLEIVVHTSRAADTERIANIAREQDVSMVIVGLPVTMSGEERGQAVRTRAFGDQLAAALHVPVLYQDEGGSTAQVSAGAARRRDRPRNAPNVHPARRRGKPRVDDLAAAVILQSYLDAQAGPRE
jgi:putative Holliday junction resolvase